MTDMISYSNGGELEKAIGRLFPHAQMRDTYVLPILNEYFKLNKEISVPSSAVRTQDTAARPVGGLFGGALSAGGVGALVAGPFGFAAGAVVGGFVGLVGGLVANPSKPEDYDGPQNEAVVQAIYALRPGFPVIRGSFSVPSDAYALWKEEIPKKQAILNDLLQLVGSVWFDRGARGTCWEIYPGLAITNAHVVGNRLPGDITIKWNLEHEVKSYITSNVNRIAYVSGIDLDFAVIQYEPRKLTLKNKIKLQQTPVKLGNTTRNVVAIGIPVSPNQTHDQKILQKVFPKGFVIKYLSPGKFTKYNERVLDNDSKTYVTRHGHDCSTLGGSSGSVILDLDTCCAIGLHCSGNTDGNWCVAIAEIVKVLDAKKISFNSA